MNNIQGIEFHIERNVNENLQFLPELKIYFMVDGYADITIGQSSYHIEREECLLINSGTPFSIRTSEESITAITSFSPMLLAETAKDHKHLFLFQTDFRKDVVYYEMVKIIREIIFNEVNDSHRTSCNTLSLMLKLMDYLMEHYLIDTTRDVALQSNDDLRVNQLMQYVNQNYKENISLADVADEMFVSKSTLSRLFKKQTGTYFADYVNQVRIRSAVQELLHTDKTITRIAMDNGFSNPSAFHRVFTGYYDMSPSDFKKAEKEKTESINREKETLREHLLRSMKENDNDLGAFYSIGKVNAEIEVGEGAPLSKIWNKVINIGEVHNLTNANMQYHTIYLSEQLGFRYIRLWTVFSEKLMITDGVTAGHYNYDNLDAVLDFLQNNRLYPYFDFANRPDTAVNKEGSTLYYKNDGIVFETKELWLQAVESLLNHVITRYGIDKVRNWGFELSRDPFHTPETQCYKGTDYDHCDTFRLFYQTIKRIVPSAGVGGSMFIVDYDKEFIREFLRYCKDNSCVPDFVSCMIFPYVTTTELNEQGVYYRRSMDPEHELKDIRLIRSMLEESGLNDCKLYVSEINNSLSNRNYLNDSCFRATYFAKKIADIAPYCDLVIPWMGSDWVSNYFDARSIANGGSGLLTKDTIRKPAYFAFSFLNMLGETLLEKGENYIVTSKGNRSYYILCYNYKEYSTNYFLQEENMESPDDINKMFQDIYPIELNLTLKGLPDDTSYIIKKRTINQTEGSLLNKWRQFEYIQELSGNDVKYLRSYCSPSLSMTRQTTRGGKLTMKLTLENQEISLLHVYKEL